MNSYIHNEVWAVIYIHWYSSIHRYTYFSMKKQYRYSTINREIGIQFWTIAHVLKYEPWYRYSTINSDTGTQVLTVIRWCIHLFILHVCMCYVAMPTSEMSTVEISTWLGECRFYSTPSWQPPTGVCWLPSIIRSGQVWVCRVGELLNFWIIYFLKYLHTMTMQIKFWQQHCNV
jgi:hypothetical protein